MVSTTSGRLTRMRVHRSVSNLLSSVWHCGARSVNVLSTALGDESRATVGHMRTRAIATMVVAMALLLATALPASAAVKDSNLTWRTKYVCATTYTDGSRGALWVRATSNTSRRTATVEYSMWGFDGPRHSALDMPMGEGKIMVLRQEYITAGGGGFLAKRPGPPRSLRYDCQDPTSGASDLTSEIVYLHPPVKPTVADVEAYCAEFALENPDHSETPDCVPVLINNLRL
jgi:hypothetical protein